MEPTAEEYAEIKGLDIDPDTFDKATYKRVRSMGATHDEVKDASSQGIPIEDYETARINNPGSHHASVHEALGYQDHYKKTMLDNDKTVIANPSQFEEIRGIVEGNKPHVSNAVQDIFGHHLALKNRPQYDGVYPDAPFRRRANEWMMSECSKIDPSLTKHIGSSAYDERGILPVDDYNERINRLISHHRYSSMFANTVKDHVIHNRIINALTNLGSGHYMPVDYRQDKYEEA